MSLQVLWPQGELSLAWNSSTGFLLILCEEVQLLFTAVPRQVGWYSLSYNASALRKNINI